MKNRTKKIIATACLGVTLAGGSMFLGGCEMTEGQLTGWEQRADAVIESLNSTNTKVEELNNSLSNLNQPKQEKISKQEAYDMLRLANHNMQMCMFDYIPFAQTYYDMSEGEAGKRFTQIMVPTKDALMMTMYEYDLATNEWSDKVYIEKVDFNDAENCWEYYKVAEEESLESMFGTSSGHKEYVKMQKSYGERSLLPTFGIDNIVNYDCDENGVYTFDLVVTCVDDMSSDDSGNYVKYMYDYTIQVNDNRIVKASCLEFDSYTSGGADGCTFETDLEGNYIPDGFGGYVIKEDLVYSEDWGSFEYSYGEDIEYLEDMLAKVADVEARIESGDLVVQSN